MKDAASDLVIIDADVQTFVSAECVERIPTGPSNQPVKSRFLRLLADFPDADCLIRCRQNKFFYSLRYLNKILSANTPKSNNNNNLGPLRVHLAVRMDAEGDEYLVLGLQGFDGSKVPLEDNKSAGRDPLQAVVDQGSAAMNAGSRGPSVDRIDIGRSLETKTLDSASLWQQLQDLQLTNTDVLKSLSEDRIPQALSVLAGNPDCIIPFGVLPSGEHCSIKPFANGCELPENLGVPAAQKDVEDLFNSQLLLQIEQF